MFCIEHFNAKHFSVKVVDFYFFPIAIKGHKNCEPTTVFATARD